MNNNIIKEKDINMLPSLCIIPSDYISDIITLHCCYKRKRKSVRFNEILSNIKETYSQDDYDRKPCMKVRSNKTSEETNTNHNYSILQNGYTFIYNKQQYSDGDWADNFLRIGPANLYKFL
jgi:hypothetical protein